MSTTLKNIQNMLDFSDTDLNANRRGKLSAAQVEYLRRQAEHELWAVLILPFLVIIGILAMVNFWLSLPAMMVMGAIMAGIYGFHRQQVESIKHHKVVKVSGDLTRIPRINSITHYAISIDGESFPVDREFYYQVPEGYYTVYLLEDGRQILGLEPGKPRSRRTKSSAANKKSTSTRRSRATTKSQTAKRAKPKSRTTRSGVRTS